MGTRPTRMGTRLHGMARRAEEIERNRGRFRKNLVGGTEISNLANVIVGWPINLPSIKRGRIKPMPPLRLENAVVLQLLTDRNRIAELTVMPAVLSTTIDRDALSLHGATTLVWVGRSVGPRPRASGYIEEANDLLSATRAGLTGCRRGAAGAINTGCARRPSTKEPRALAIVPLLLLRPRRAKKA